GTGGTGGAGGGGTGGAGGGGTGGTGGGTGGSGALSYAQVVLADAPVAYWRLGETSGLVAHDSSGNGYDLACLGGFTLGVAGLQTSDGDTAIELDGVDGLLQGPDALDFATATEFTAEGWVKLDRLPDTGSQFGMVIKRDTIASLDEGWALRIEDNGEAEIRLWLNDVSTRADAVTAITVGVRVHVAGVFDNGTLRLYLNGAQEDVVTGVSNPLDTAGVLTLGFDPDSGYLDGVLDEVALYDQALTQVQLLNHIAAAD
ncbi:MAG: LamG domain-containing protein, partial [Deltaproteobacteria bacterium]|nr:LamG domain-containing protein [Deltaproteobacteria bacterium]